jgi:myo-inositol-1(or 4)-monophosphatase
MSALERERDVAVEAARQAGALIRKYYEGKVENLRTEDNPLTLADRDANNCIQEIVTKAFPADGWLSEEFTQHIPEFCVCIALVENGRPIVGVEYNPAADRLYVAVKGQGTTVNGAPAHVSRQADVRKAEVLASRSEDKRGEWDVFKPLCQVVLTGSVAFKLAEMATGAGDATFTLTPKNEWDICAGSILVEEAGGKVTGLDGKPLVFNQPSPLRPGMVSSNGVLHDALMRLIAEYGEQAKPKKR